jgi:hypothetical protein
MHPTRKRARARDEALKRLEQEKKDEQIQLDILNKVFEKLSLTKEKKRILLLLSNTC